MTGDLQQIHRQGNRELGRTCNHWCSGVPTAVTYDGAPLTTSATDLPAIDISLVFCRPRISGRTQHVNLAGERCIKIPDIDGSIVTATVHVPTICAAWRREMASYQSLEDFVATESDYAAVVWVRFVFFFVIGSEAVVEACGIVLRVDRVKSICRHHLTQVPQLHGLVLGVAEHIPSIAFAIDVRKTFSVPNKRAGLTSITHGAPIPNFERRIVGARV